MPKQVLFICIFNIKRSVVAQHMLDDMLMRAAGDRASKIRVSSAGFIGREVSEWFETNAIPYPYPLFNRPPPERIRATMSDRGMDISGHRSQPVDQEILRRSDLIIPLLAVLKRDLIAAYPEIEDKIVLPNELLADDTTFLWEDTSAVPNDSRMFNFAHGNKDYVTAVINEIEDFLRKSFDPILEYFFGADGSTSRQ